MNNSDLEEFGSTLKELERVVDCYIEVIQEISRQPAWRVFQSEDLRSESVEVLCKVLADVNIPAEQRMVVAQKLWALQDRCSNSLISGIARPLGETASSIME